MLLRIKMKHFIIAATLLASLGANASAFVCKDMNGKKATIENGVAKQGEFMGYAGTTITLEPLRMVVASLPLMNRTGSMFTG